LINPRGFSGVEPMDAADRDVDGLVSCAGANLIAHHHLGGPLHEFGVTRSVMPEDLPHPVPRRVVETMIAAVDIKGRDGSFK
jgi:hypothetical protein